MEDISVTMANKLQRQVRKGTKANTYGMPKYSKKRKVINQKGAFGRYVPTDYYTGPRRIRG